MQIKKYASMLSILLIGTTQMPLTLALEANNQNQHSPKAVITTPLIESIENTENLIGQRRRNRTRRRARRRSRPRPYRPRRRAFRRARRREFRHSLRNEARRYRRRNAAGRLITGVVGAGIGAAIAESNRNNRRDTEVIIIDQGQELRERTYYDALYECDHLDQGGYYNADDLKECLQGN